MHLPGERERLRGILKAAGNQINQGRPGVALEMLKPIREQVESLEGTPEWVELPLLTGEALLASGLEEALSYLNMAAGRAEKINDLPIDIQIRIQEHLGHFFGLSRSDRLKQRNITLPQNTSHQMLSPTRPRRVSS